MVNELRITNYEFFSLRIADLGLQIELATDIHGFTQKFHSPKKAGEKNRMKLKELRDILEAEVLWGNDYLCKEIKMASASDLLSDVLAFTKAGTLLLTGLVNPQVIRTAEMVDISTICFVRGKKPEKSTIELAKEKKIPLLYTKFPMYESCGKLYVNGLAGCSEVQEEM